jgi:hypothetical protein
VRWVEMPRHASTSLLASTFCSWVARQCDSNGFDLWIETVGGDTNVNSRVGSLWPQFFRARYVPRVILDFREKRYASIWLATPN